MGVIIAKNSYLYKLIDKDLPEGWKDFYVVDLFHSFVDHGLEVTCFYRETKEFTKRRVDLVYKLDLAARQDVGATESVDIDFGKTI